MQRLLAEASPSVRSCLQRQVGTVAVRNTCDGPWQATLDFQVNWRPTLLGLNRRLQVSVITYNFLRGLDELLHGTPTRAGWGLSTRPDNTLLYVTGFDPVAQRYAYTVNERFGATYGSATAYRPPFQIGIQARCTIGPDRVRQALDALRGGGGIAGAMAAMGGGPGGPGAGPGGFGGGGFRGPVANPLQLIARIDSALPNPAAVVLGMRDSLQLDSGQVVLLTLLRDSLARRNGVVMDSLARHRRGRGAERGCVHADEPDAAAAAAVREDAGRGGGGHRQRARHPARGPVGEGAGVGEGLPAARRVRAARRAAAGPAEAAARASSAAYAREQRRTKRRANGGARISGGRTAADRRVAAWKSVRVSSRMDSTLLTAWNRSRDLASRYRAAALPAQRFELGSQLRRAATSVPANIAEGFARRGARELSHFLSIALGSLAEIDALLALIRELGYLDAATLDGLEALRDGASTAVFALMRRMRGSG